MNLLDKGNFVKINESFDLFQMQNGCRTIKREAIKSISEL